SEAVLLVPIRRHDPRRGVSALRGRRFPRRGAGRLPLPVADPSQAVTTHPKLDVKHGRLSGAIVCESLRPGSVLEVHGLAMTKLSRYDITDPAPGQPSRWTLLEFESPDGVASDLAQDLSGALLVEGGWYANFSTSGEVFV